MTVPAAPASERDYVYGVLNLHNLQSGNAENAVTWKVVRGTVPLNVTLRKVYGRADPNPALTHAITEGTSLRYVLFAPQGEAFISPVLRDSFEFNWDTTSVPDGTYALGIQYVDGPNLHWLRKRLFQVVVDNVAGSVAGPQYVPIVGFFYDDGIDQQEKVDWVFYPGSYQLNTVHPYPYRFVPPASTLPDLTPLLWNNAAWFVEDLVHNNSGLYTDTPALYQAPGGHIVSEGFLPQVSNTVEQSITAVQRHDYWCGGRNRAVVSPYSTFAPDPTEPGWYGIDIAGRLFRIRSDGSMVTYAGPVTKRHRTDVVPYDYRDSSVSWATRLAEQDDLLGSFENGLLFRESTDLVFDPRNPKVIYVADAGNHRIAKVDMNASPAAITTYAGTTQIAGYRDGSRTTALFNAPYSVAIQQDGTLYVADRMNNAIRKIDPLGAVTTVLGGPNGPLVPSTTAIKGSQTLRDQLAATASFVTATINYPQVIRFDSSGNLIVGEDWTRSIRKINFHTQQVEWLAWLPDNHHGTWIWLDVDVKGNVGPKDDILVAVSETLGLDPRTGGQNHNNQLLRISADGSRPIQDMIRLGWPSKAQSGRGDKSTEPAGHYPWAVTVDDEEGRFIATGYGTSGVKSVRLSLPTDPSSFDAAAFDKGYLVLHTGTAAVFPFGARPGLSEIHGHTGFNRLGTVLTFDDLALLSNADLVQYIHGGMGGIVPRPEITGNDLAHLIYYIRRNSLQAATTEISLPAIKSDLQGFGLFNPSDTQKPQVIGVTTEQLDSSTVSIRWQTDEPTVGMIRYGPTPNLGLLSPIEVGYGTQHQISISGLEHNGVSHGKYYFSLISKDINGASSTSAGSFVIH